MKTYHDYILPAQHLNTRLISLENFLVHLIQSRIRLEQHLTHSTNRSVPQRRNCLDSGHPPHNTIESNQTPGTYSRTTHLLKRARYTPQERHTVPQPASTKCAPPRAPISTSGYPCIASGRRCIASGRSCVPLKTTRYVCGSCCASWWRWVPHRECGCVLPRAC
ncbi:hypothetical protein BDV95DRAFT_577971 [Massariosphaeria phaeospora]|uniref:Uncharacterized protein n=1 Tax=Massariosphaeria phaeospora TaxID=100035 RepID=A0A7C8M3C3_9PLEO|nr:hypothetical protein BDV95DRAFT_577971 [Massariosphaeria phaeospora]